MPSGRTKIFLLIQSVVLAFVICAAPSGHAQQTSAPAAASAPASSQDTKTTSQSKAVEKDGVYEVGGPVLPPKLIKAPSPEYTDAARRFHIEGDCLLSLVIDATGKPKDVVIEKKIGLGLDENALRVVKKYRFQPATLNGKPVPVKINVIVNFLMCKTKEECQQKEAAFAASHSKNP